MSASFPNSWEPYGSSQQSQGLGWRKAAATRPASTHTLSERWKNAHAAAVQPLAFQAHPVKPPPAPGPAVPSPGPAVPSPKPKSLDLAAFRSAEEQHRILSRFESIRTEVRDVAAAVAVLSDRLDAHCQQSRLANKSFHDDLSSLHPVIASLNNQTTQLANLSNSDQKLRKAIQPLLVPLNEHHQTTAKAVENLADRCTKLSTDVAYLSEALLSSVDTRVAHTITELFNGTIMSVLDHRIQTALSRHAHASQAFAHRMEHLLKLQTIQNRPQMHTDMLQPFTGHATHQGPSHACGDRNTMPLGSHHHLQQSSCPVHTVPRCTASASVERRPCTSPVIAVGSQQSELDPFGDGMTEPPLAQPRTPLAAIPRTMSTRTIAEGSFDMGPVWAKLRIRRHQDMKIEPAVQRDAVIDLTKSDDSGCSEDANFFEESQSHCHRASNLEASDGSECARKKVKPIKKYQLRQKSPYLTRSEKRRRKTRL